MTAPSRIDELTEAVAAYATAAQPLDALVAARSIRAHADALELEAVRDARAAGASWAKIGAAYGLTKQGAQQRFAKVRKNKD